MPCRLVVAEPAPAPFELTPAALVVEGPRRESPGLADRGAELAALAGIRIDDQGEELARVVNDFIAGTRVG